MTRAQQLKGLKLPEPRGTLAEQDDWYRAFALRNTVERLSRAPQEQTPSSEEPKA